MTKERINHWRERLTQGHTGTVDWAKVAHDRYDTVEELLLELEREEDKGQPQITGLDWEEIEHNSQSPQRSREGGRMMKHINWLGIIGWNMLWCALIAIVAPEAPLLLKLIGSVGGVITLCTINRWI